MRLYNKATGQYTDQAPRSIAAWGRRGWEPVDPNPEPDEGEETDTAAEDNKSRGKSSARTKKD